MWLPKKGGEGSKERKMKKQIIAKKKFDETIIALLDKGILPMEVFDQGISSLSELGLIASKNIFTRNQFVSFMVHKILDEIDDIDKHLEKPISNVVEEMEMEIKNYDETKTRKKKIKPIH